ncbi:MAG: hypothetical protein JSS09_06825, partial [Verrucomicrobia bacterium]|nr:hypothetical protein [Verrucomicrobiota bacterium]
MAVTEVQPKEFTNDLVHCTVHQRPHCVVEFSVTASKDLISQARNH